MAFCVQQDYEDLVKNPDVVLNTQKLLQSEWRTYRQCVQRTRKELSIENVHQLRIQIHRLLAVLEASAVLTTNPFGLHLMDQLKKTKKKMSALRDLQIQIQRLQSPRLKRFEDFRQYLKRQQKRRADEVRDLLRDLPLRKQSRQKKKLQRVLSQAGRSMDPLVARQKLRTQAQQVFLEARPPKASGQKISTSTLHRWRLAVKQARYLAEVQAAVARGPKAPILTFKKLQSVLGKIQNEVALIKTFDRYLKKKNSLQLRPLHQKLRQELVADERRLIRGVGRFLRTR